MKLRSTLTLLLVVVLLQAYSQKEYKPTIVVLTPLNSQYDSVLSAEAREDDVAVRISAEDKKMKLKEVEGEEENIRRMQMAEFEYSANLNFASNFSLGLTIMVGYRVFGETDKCLIIPSHDTTGSSLEALQRMAIKHKMNWVVNPVSLVSFVKDGKKFSKATIILYDHSRKTIVLNKEYIGEQNNPGFELSCESGSLECTINNLIGYATHDIVVAILGRYQH